MIENDFNLGLFSLFGLSSRDLLWKAAKIKDKNNSAVMLCWKLPGGALLQIVTSLLQLVSKIKMLAMLLNFGHPKV